MCSVNNSFFIVNRFFAANKKVSSDNGLSVRKKYQGFIGVFVELFQATYFAKEITLTDCKNCSPLKRNRIWGERTASPIDYFL